MGIQLTEPQAPTWVPAPGFQLSGVSLHPSWALWDSRDPSQPETMTLTAPMQGEDAGNENQISYDDLAARLPPAHPRGCTPSRSSHQRASR